MVRSPCVDDVCRKVYQSAPFLHPIIMSAIIFKMFVINKHVCQLGVPVCFYTNISIVCVSGDFRIESKNMKKGFCQKR